MTTKTNWCKTFFKISGKAPDIKEIKKHLYFPKTETINPLAFYKLKIDLVSTAELAIADESIPHISILKSFLFFTQFQKFDSDLKTLTISNAFGQLKKKDLDIFIEEIITDTNFSKDESLITFFNALVNDYILNHQHQDTTLYQAILEIADEKIAEDTASRWHNLIEYGYYDLNDYYNSLSIAGPMPPVNCRVPVSNRIDKATFTTGVFVMDSGSPIDIFGAIKYLYPDVNITIKCEIKGDIKLELDSKKDDLTQYTMIDQVRNLNKHKGEK